MKTRSILLSFLFMLCSCAAFGAGYKQDFVSPDKRCHILYQGASDHGNGTFYDVSDGKKKLILKEYVRVGPDINWMTDSIAEIFFSEGSPAYHSEYYDCKQHRISPSYSMSIAFEPKQNLIAVLDDEEISFYKLFGEKEFYRAKTPGVGLTSYFDCESEAKFDDGNMLHITMKCLDSKDNVDLKIKVPN